MSTVFSTVFELAEKFQLNTISMELKINAIFYLRDKQAKNKTSIVLYLTNDNSLREKISTGLSIKPIEWNQLKQKSKSVEINNRLKEILDIIEEYEIDIRYKNERDFDYLELKKLILSGSPRKFENSAQSDLFSSYINQYYELHKNVKAFNTIKKYPTLKRFFESNYPNLRAKDINNEFANNLKATYLKKKLLNNTINKNFQLIRVVLTWLFDTNKLPKFPLDSFRHSADEKVDDVFLEAIELEKIIKLDLSEKPNLERIKDQFLLASYTGTDWCDLHHLNKKNLNITKNDKKKYFRFNRAKTEKKAIYSNPPCDLETEKILDKYNWELEFISYDKSLQHLKTVCKLAKIDEKITLKSYSGSQLIEETRPKYNWIGWKSGRRTFITNKLLDKKQSEAVLFAVGQTKHSTLTKYQKASADHMVELLDK